MMKKALYLLLVLFAILLWMGPGGERVSLGEQRQRVQEGSGRKVKDEPSSDLRNEASDRHDIRGDDFTVSDPELHQAILKAEHLVRPLTAEQAAMEQNFNVDYFATQPHQGMSVRFREDGVELRPDRSLGWAFEMKVSGELEQVAGDTVGYRAGGILQWFRNAPEGLQHGYTLDQEPELDEKGWAKLQSMTDGNLQADFDDESEGDLIFSNEDGEGVLKYGGLRVWDATGRELAALMEPTAEGFSIAYASDGAVYPVTVDPTFTHVRDYFTNEVAEGAFYYDDQTSLRDLFGSAVEISDEWAFVGNLSDNEVDRSDTGAVYVFRRSGSNWAFKQRLTIAEGEANDNFGGEIVLDDNRLFITAKGVGAGAVYVFGLEGPNWVQKEGVFAAEVSTYDWSGFGGDLVVSGDYLAATATYRAPFPLPLQAGVMVWRKTGGVWEFIEFLNPADSDDSTISGDGFGDSMCLVEDDLSGTSGDYLLFAGASRHDLQGDGSTLSNVGAVYVFRIQGSTVTEIEKISPDPAVTDSDFRFGRSLGTYPKAKYFYVGATGFDRDVPGTSDQGIVYQFQRSDLDDWSLQSVLEAPGTAAETSGNRFGSSLGLSGNFLFVGENPSAAGNDDALYAYDTDDGSFSSYKKITKARNLPAPPEGFGSTFAATDHYLIVGMSARRPEGSSDPSGGVELFMNADGVWRNTHIIDPLDAGVSKVLGRHVKLKKDVALVSAPSATTATGIGSGQVSVFEKLGDGWMLISILELPAGGIQRSGFGNKLALSGNLLAVGTIPGYPTGNSRVIVFKKANETWEMMGEALPNSPDVLDGFGASLAISQDLLAVGAPADFNEKGFRSGGVNFYKLHPGTNGVDFSDTMFLEGGQEGDQFGTAVSIHEKEILVGAPGAGLFSDPPAGEAYLMLIGSKTAPPVQVMIPSNGVSGDDFGEIVELGNGIAMVAAPDAEFAAGDRGIAYVYQIEEGVTSESEQLHTSGDVQGGFFSATMSDGRVAVGYSRHQLGGTLPGAVFVFKKQGPLWPLELRLDYPGETIGPGFGSAVSLDGNRILVGAISDRPVLPNGDGVPAGSAFFFELGSGEGLYQRWATARGLTGGSAEPGATTNGVVNLIDYGFGISESEYDPTLLTRAVVDDTPFSIKFVSLPDGGGMGMKVGFMARKSAGLRYVPQFSRTLLDGSWEDFSEAPNETYVNFNFDRREYVEPISGSPNAIFVRVKIEFVE